MASKLETTAVVLAGIAIFIGIVALSAWGLMALSGALGHAFEQGKLFISYGQAFLVTLALMFIGNFFSKGSK